MEKDQASRFIHDLLKHAISKNASDIFISADFPPAMKIDGKITPVAPQPLTAQHTKELVRSVMNDRQTEEFEATREANFAISPPGIGRFRVSAYVQQGSAGMVLRKINTEIPTLDITGGAPELHQRFDQLVTRAVALGRKVMDRCNLTITQLPNYRYLPAFLAEHQVEVVASLARKQNNTQMASNWMREIQQLPSLTLVNLDELLAHAAAEIAARHRLRGSDAVYVAVARRFGATLITLDAEQQERAAAVVPVRGPA